MMRDALLAFPKQFDFDPIIENASALQQKNKFVVLGMGGSQLAATLLRVWDPMLTVVSHREYGLPEQRPQEQQEQLHIASSYSGNTEEILDGFSQALKRSLPLAVITVGGTLLALAKAHNVPYVQIPDTGIQPRCSLGFMFRACLALMGRHDALAQTRELASFLTQQQEQLEEQGRILAQKLKDHIPVIYTATRNAPLGHIWKIKCNETAKIPAFSNVFPELNHNEMNGFDVAPTSKHLSERFAFVFLRDPDDHPRNRMRMEIVEQLYTQRGLPVHVIDLQGTNPFEKIFTSMLLADWTALSLAELYGLESEQVPMVEEFKRRIV